ncbi:MAG TPA: hypothetical protein PLV36_15790, partial [Zoogloea sp.]|nr:hypothetical protein [Zoogloea sp.]
MPDSDTRSVARYGRWLQRSVGPHFTVGIGSSEGGLLWPESSAELAGTLSSLPCAELECLPSMQRLDSADGPIYLRAITLPDACGAGWLVAIARHDAAPADIELDALADAMDDVAAALDDATHLNTEMDLLAGELAERYEELHLVYEIDRHLANQDLGTEVLQDLLQSCAEQLNADVACFVRPADNLTISATNLSKPI